jgi:hypothetical protein
MEWWNIGMAEGTAKQDSEWLAAKKHTPNSPGVSPFSAATRYVKPL